MPEPASDSRLIAESIKTPERFAAIFDRHFDALFGYLQRRLGPSVADELVNELFLIAFRDRAKYDTAHKSARPWLFGIATNLMRRHQRTERRKLLAYSKLGEDPVENEFELAERRVDSARQGPALATGLARLRAKDRHVLLLWAWAGLSYEEIATALRIPLGTVRSRLARARREMAELISGSGQ